MAEKETNPFDEAAGVPKIEGQIKPKPQFSDRISKRVLWVLFGVVILFFVVFVMALDAMDRKKASAKANAENPRPNRAQSRDLTAENFAPKDLLDAKPSNEQIDSFAGSGSASLIQPVDQVPLGGQPGTGLEGNGLGQASNAPVVQQLTPEQQAQQIAKMDRIKRMEQARSAGLSVEPYANAGSAKKGSADAAMDPANLLKTLAAASQQLPGQTGIGGQLMAQQAPKGDSEQDEKLEFLKNAGRNPQKYLPNSPEPAVSKNELKRGSYITMRLESAVNSGQPGRVRARVTEDVYDTVTGCRLLVPAMTVVEGTYDSKVALGQTRNLILWNYMGFEDGSDLDLGGMQGYDSSGAAGMVADVDNHYLRLFGMAFGMSMVTAGVQMSVPPSSDLNSNTQTPQQAIANALTQQYGQLGAQLLGKYMQIQPTLRNYPGERFTVMLPLTVVFNKIWRNRCLGPESA